MPSSDLSPLELRPIERIVLLGYMASGKSTIGASLARRLEWSFLDFDVEIERREGRSIQELVADDGDEHLRGREASLTEEVSLATHLVIAPGGGWITVPELLEAIRPGTLSVWLRVSAEETVRRIRDDRIERPFRNHPDPLAAVRQMLSEREGLYRRSDVMVPAEGRGMEEVAFEIEQLVRTRGMVAG